MKTLRKVMVWIGCGLVSLLFGYGLVTYLSAKPAGQESSIHTGAQGESQDEDTMLTGVSGINPKSDPSLVISVEQLLAVEPFFIADLRAQVAGSVRYIQKDIGNRVSKGELLVAIDVPQLEEELAGKKAVVIQRLNDLKVARAMADNARALAEVAKESIELRKAEVVQAEATRDYRKLRFDRFVNVARGGGVLQNVVDEEARDFRSAEGATMGAAAMVRKATADFREKESLIATAEADIELKQSWVDVALKDRDHAQAMLEFARIRAPFNGVILKRKVDVGTFVQNASTGQSEPIITVARTDIVTVVTKVPDHAAPFVTLDTEAVIQIDELPGVVMRGKVTRFSPSIQNNDRTMRVEVDLFNDTPQRYDHFRARAVSTWLAGLSATSPLTLAPLLAASHESWSAESRSLTDPLPMMPVVSGKTTPPLLLPGMTGYMRLNLRSIQDAYLIPSSAVFIRGGKPYILEVKDGVTRSMPVRVQVTDGKLSKVSLITQESSATQGKPEILSELTGKEVIIANRQAEIGEGRTVKVTMKSW